MSKIERDTKVYFAVDLFSVIIWTILDLTSHGAIFPFVMMLLTYFLLGGQVIIMAWEASRPNEYYSR